MGAPDRVLAPAQQFLKQACPEAAGVGAKESGSLLRRGRLGWTWLDREVRGEGEIPGKDDSLCEAQRHVREGLRGCGKLEHPPSLGVPPSLGWSER